MRACKGNIIVGISHRDSGNRSIPAARGGRAPRHVRAIWQAHVVFAGITWGSEAVVFSLLAQLALGLGSLGLLLYNQGNFNLNINTILISI